MRHEDACHADVHDSPCAAAGKPACFVTYNKCMDPAKRMTARFKCGVAFYFLAHGCCEADVVGDVASLGGSTVELYLRQFCMGVLAVLKPIYMPAKPRSPEMIARVRAQFAARRGISNVAMAVDGTHVPFRGGPDYRNYKGWTSILAVAFVDSYYLFVDADVGCAGRAGDNGVLASCWLLEQIKADPEAWLGVDGVIAADGGASDGGELLLNPIANAREPEDCWYNFCHSSTRFPVEETFGRWKNRWRFLLREMHLDHKTANLLIYVSMILHNLCTIHKDDAVDFTDGVDDEWRAFFEKFEADACPSCKRRGSMHCPHIARFRTARAVTVAGAAAKRDAIRDALWAELCEAGEQDHLGEMHARAAHAQADD